MYKTTKKDFERFVSSFKRYQKQFGIDYYDVEFAHVKLDGDHARIYINEHNQCAVIHFNSITGDDMLAIKSIDGIARHEALHLLLSRYTDLAEKRYLRKGELCDEEERIVRTLTNCLGHKKGRVS